MVVYHIRYRECIDLCEAAKKYLKICNNVIYALFAIGI